MARASILENISTISATRNPWQHALGQYPAPQDIDIIMIMRNDFREEDYTEDLLPVLDHQRAQSELGASIFWIRSRSILLESVDEFAAHWQIKRDLTRRGIVEIVEA